MDYINRIKELVDLLNHASDAYYNSGKTIMTDYQFDVLMNELKTLESTTGIILSNSPTHNIGSEIKTRLNKVAHTRPMLSLDKCHSVKELIDFAGNDNCYLSVKCDGLTTRLTYSNGELVGAETRGDGAIGVDVLFHIKNYINIPMTIPCKDTFVIDGESVIFSSDFEKINASLSNDEKFANARNLASGTLNNLDSNITKQRRMRFIAWRVIGGINDDSNWNRLCIAEEYGFDIAPMYQYKNSLYTEALLEEQLNTLRQTANDMGLPMDGIVIAKDSEKLAMSMGRTEKFFRHSIAYKFEDEKHESRLQYIDWTLGKSGILTPTAVFNPINIDGSTVERASLHNISIIKSLGITNHCTVKVFKANCIIPQINDCLNDGDSPIDPPKYCPICSGETKVVKDNDSEVLVCTNPNCSGKLLGKLSFFASKKAMDIDGMSESTIEFLINKGWVKTYIDLYHLDRYVDEWAKCEGFGKKSVEKLLAAIEKSRKVGLAHFITALSIPGVGSSAAKAISNQFGGDFNIMIQNIMRGFDFTTIDGFGETINANIQRFFYDMQSVCELATEMNFVVEEKSKDTSLEGLKFCITGSFSQSRDEIKKKLEDKGAKFVSSVSKNLDVLFCGDKAGSKLTKAQSLGIRIVNENELMGMISNG